MLTDLSRLERPYAELSHIFYNPSAYFFIQLTCIIAAICVVTFLTGRSIYPGRNDMPVKPTLEQLRQLATESGLHMSDEDLTFFQGQLAAMLATYTQLDQLNEPELPVKYARTGGYRPTPAENPLNAWYQKCSIKGAESGPLAGKRIAIKDNVCVAGIAMMNGSAAFEGYVPDVDATIVTRILDAGGEIVGKAVCESFCASGGSHTSDSGPVLNPHNPAYSAGGSSSGSAALVVADECDMAIGCDQGGSIRIPSSWSGAYGLKPTHGLVPYTNIFGMENSIDHAGPMAATVEDVALLLEVIAGPDGLDPRQKGLQPEAYTRALTGSVEGLRIGIVREGFQWSGISEEAVSKLVKESAYSFEKPGATISEISIPLHYSGMSILMAIVLEGMTAALDGPSILGYSGKGYYSRSMINAYTLARQTRIDAFPDSVKQFFLLGKYIQRQYQGRYYAKAQNLQRVLAQAYDDALQEVDLLVMPTTPTKAEKLPGPDATRAEYAVAAGTTILNTAPFDATGHPAMSIPCGLVDGLPVGMMLIGRHGAEATILRAAHAFEQQSNYVVRPQRLAATAI
jgi:amidase